MPIDYEYYRRLCQGARKQGLITERPDKDLPVPKTKGIKFKPAKRKTKK